MPERTFPRSQTGFPALRKSLFRTPGKSLRNHHKRITLIFNTLRQCLKNSLYADGEQPVRLYAILSDLTLHATSSPLHHFARTLHSRHTVSTRTCHLQSDALFGDEAATSGMMKKMDNHSYLPTLGWWKNENVSTI